MTLTLEELSADPVARRQAEDREVALLLHRSEIAQGEARGEARGEAKGRTELLLQLLQRKFGDVPGGVRERLTNASAEDISRWAERILFAASLEEVFQNAQR